MLFAIFEWSDYAVIAAPFLVLTVGWTYAAGRSAQEARLGRIESKLDALLRAMDLDVPDHADLSADVRHLADSGQKIAAIKAYREATGLGLREAKDAVDAYLAAR